MTRTTILAVLVACGPKVVSLEVPIDGARSFILGLEYEDALRVSAHDPGDPGVEATLPEIHDLEGDVRVTLLRYDDPLEVLGVSRGPLAHEENPIFAAELPVQSSAARATVFDDGASAWSEIDEVMDAFAQFRVRGPSICGVYEAHVLALTTTIGATAVAALGDGSALVLSRNGDAHRVTSSGATSIDLDLAGVTPFSIYRSPDEELWISGDGPRLVHGRIGAPFLEAPVPAAQDLRYLAGPTSGDFELYGLSKRGGLYRFDGSAWETLWPEGDTAGGGTLIHLGPGRAAGVSGLGAEVLLYDQDRRPSVDPIPVPPIIDNLVALAVLEGAGLVGATSLRNLVLVADPFERVATLPLADPPAGLHTFEGGLVAISNRGGIVEYHPSIGNCPDALGVRLPIGGLATAALGDGAFILVGHQEDPPDDFVRVVVYDRNLRVE